MGGRTERKAFYRERKLPIRGRNRNKTMSGLDGLGWPNPEDEPQRRPSDAAACSLLVVVEGEGSNSRIQIKVAHQSFALEYQNAEPGAMEWFAGQVRSALAKAGTNVAENH